MPLNNTFLSFWGSSLASGPEVKADHEKQSCYFTAESGGLLVVICFLGLRPANATGTIRLLVLCSPPQHLPGSRCGGVGVET